MLVARKKCWQTKRRINLKDLFGDDRRMEQSFVRQTRSKTQVIKKSAGAPPDAAGDVQGPTGDEFMPSIMDFEHGQDHDCAICDRPNNTELYTVQCGRCKRWHHFSCAGVDTHTVKSTEFRCTECLSKQGTETRRNWSAKNSLLLESTNCSDKKMTKA